MSSQKSLNKGGVIHQEAANNLFVVKLWYPSMVLVGSRNVPGLMRFRLVVGVTFTKFFECCESRQKLNVEHFSETLHISDHVYIHRLCGKMNFLLTLIMICVQWAMTESP